MSDEITPKRAGCICSFLHKIQEQEADIDIIGKKISYVEIRYPAEQVERGNVKAEVTIWMDGDDETIDYEVWMVYGTRKDDRKNWFIQSIE